MDACEAGTKILGCETQLETPNAADCTIQFEFSLFVIGVRDLQPPTEAKVF